MAGRGASCRVRGEGRGGVREHARAIPFSRSHSPPLHPTPTELKKQMLDRFGDALNTASANSLTSKAGGLLKSLADEFNDLKTIDKVASVQSKVDAVTGVMQKNIESALKNTDRIEDIDEKAVVLADSAQKFKNSGTALKRKMRCRYWKASWGGVEVWGGGYGVVPPCAAVSHPRPSRPPFQMMVMFSLLIIAVRVGRRWAFTPWCCVGLWFVTHLFPPSHSSRSCVSSSSRWYRSSFTSHRERKGEMGGCRDVWVAPLQPRRCGIRGGQPGV